MMKNNFSEPKIFSYEPGDGTGNPERNIEISRDRNESHIYHIYDVLMDTSITGTKEEIIEELHTTKYPETAVQGVLDKINELEKETEDLKAIQILSVEECFDEAYGASIIQYSLREGHVAFSFCNVDVSHEGYDLEQIKADVLERLNEKVEQPLWLDLSETLRNEIIESEFDMRFIEYNDEDWTEEKAEQIWKEADAHSIAVTCGEDGCYLTVYAGAMGDVNWSGHPYYGKPCLENIILSPEKIKELQEKENMFEYVDSHGDTNYVQFCMSMYCNNENLCLEMVGYEPELDAMDHFGYVTVNTEANLPYLHSLIDTNNNGANLIPFLLENGFGELTGEGVRSGYCTFPIFKFSEDKLKELCPQEFSEYQKTYGKVSSLDSKINKCVKVQESKIQENKKQMKKGTERE